MKVFMTRNETTTGNKELDEVLTELFDRLGEAEFLKEFEAHVIIGLNDIPVRTNGNAGERPGR